MGAVCAFGMLVHGATTQKTTIDTKRTLFTELDLKV
jgi:hypothetical protein